MRNYSNNRKLLTLFIMMVIGLSFATKADALTLSPVRFEISGNPGETVTKEMILANESDDTVTYYSSFANFEAQGETGTPSFVEPKDDIGMWMSSDESILLKSKGSKAVTLSIKIPQNAEPGGHFGAIFWGTSPIRPGSTVSIGAKTGTLVLLSVNGDVKEAGGLLEFSTTYNKFWYNTLPVSFTYRFKNDGGDRIKPSGKVTMHNIVYLPADRIDANPTQGNILPESTRRFDLEWVKNPRSKEYIAPEGVFAKFFDQAFYEWHNFAFGPYFAKIDLLYGTGAIRTSKMAFFFVFPWQLLICLVVIFITVWWGGKKLIKRYNRHIIQKARVGMNASHTADHA